jgi:hypothetical protein
MKPINVSVNALGSIEHLILKAASDRAGRRRLARHHNGSRLTLRCRTRRAFGDA